MLPLAHHFMARTVFGWLILSIFIIGVYLYKLGEIPTGLFCDEALIGYVGYVFPDRVKEYLVNPFFYRHFEYIVGTLEVYTTAPFVKLFGLSDFSIRLPSVAFAFFSFVIIYRLLKLLGTPFPSLSILFTAFTPLFFHIARINFGHLPAYFFMLAGFYLFHVAKRKHQRRFVVLSGLCFGVSLYGYLGFAPAVITILFALAIEELVQNSFHVRRYAQLTLLFLVVGIAYIPLVFTMKTQPDYLKRLVDKNAGKPIILSEKVRTMVQNYPKYFSVDYLFRKGEVDLPGAFITRHSVKGNGILFPITAVFAIGAALYLASSHRADKRAGLVSALALVVLYPFPDLLSTRQGIPPYSFALFPSLFPLPILAGYGMAFILRLAREDTHRRRFVIVSLYGFLIFNIWNFLNSYRQYPLASSDYWGWQYGPKEIIAYFQREKHQYDELYMTGYFNQPQVFLSFYDPKKICTNCFIGGVDQLNPSRRQLFAFRVSEMDDVIKRTLGLKFHVERVVRLPNETPEYYIGYFSGGHI